MHSSRTFWHFLSPPPNQLSDFSNPMMRRIGWLNSSRTTWFGAYLCRPTPRGLPSSLATATESHILLTLVSRRTISMIHRRHDCLRVALLVRLFVAPDHHREGMRGTVVVPFDKLGHISPDNSPTRANFPKAKASVVIEMALPQALQLLERLWRGRRYYTTVCSVS